MATTDGHEDAGVSRRRARALARAEFFQTVRAIAAASGRAIGDDTRAHDEPIRFGVVDGLQHPDVEVVALDRPGDEGPVHVTVGHIGMTGPMGVMPDHYSDMVVERRRQRDEALARFLDLFNHRAISLFYRAWAKYRLPVRFEEDGGRLTDPFSRALAALAGIGRLDNPGALAAAGSLARRVRSAGALGRIIASMFALPVTVEEMRPRWVRIEPGERTRLGGALAGHGTYAELGANAVIGEAVCDVGGRFRICVGPLDWAAFHTLLAEDGPRRRIVEAVRFAVGGTIDFDLQLILRAEDVPRLRLDRSVPARLSQTGWLLSAPATRDRDDAVFRGEMPALPIGAGPQDRNGQTTVQPIGERRSDTGLVPAEASR